MSRSRVSRLRKTRASQRGLVIAGIAAAVLVVAAIAAAIATGVTGRGDGPVVVTTHENPLPDSSLGASDGIGAAAMATTGVTADVEVPDVVGKDLDTALMVIEAGGLVAVTRVADTPAPGYAPGAVVAQAPASGERVDRGGLVTLYYQPSAAVTAANRILVVIDPGHQAEADLRPEPLGPGSTITKERARGGVTGVVTGIPEYRQALSIGLRLRERLQREGIGVLMTRTTDKVNISNRERAVLGNRANADLVVRIHFDGVKDSGAHGVATLYAGGNVWTRPITTESERAARIVQAAMVRSTGAADRGISEDANMTGFNWSKRPAILVTCGFLSSPAEDRRIATAAYQDRIVSGLTAGILEYVRR